MDKVEEIRQWAYNKAEARATETATVAQILAEAQKIEAYVDVNQNADPKTLKPKE